MASADRIGWKVLKTHAKLPPERHNAPAASATRRGPDITKEPANAMPPSAHVKVTPVRSGTLEEIHVAAVPDRPRADVRLETASVYAAVLQQIEDPGSLRIVAERVFGKLSAKDRFLSARVEALRTAGIPPDGPVTYIEGAPVEGAGLAGVHLTFVRGNSPGVRIDPIGGREGIRGYRVTSGEVCRAYLSAVHGVDSGSARVSAAAQASRMFERASILLESAGLSYRNVVCTRIFLRRLLEWYDEFNGVRTPCYEKLGLMNGEPSAPVPASTGIQGKISDDCECFMDVLAVSRRRGDASPFTRLFNPLQNEATEYGSSFARGVAVDAPDVRYVVISGTAAIDENGKSVHPDDPVGQTRRTIANFETILKAGGASPADLYHAVWYCKHPSHAKIIREEMRARGWPESPFPIVCADVCRHDLLVEIDGSAVIPAV